jgi:hypothetical protein
MLEKLLKIFNPYIIKINHLYIKYIQTEFIIITLMLFLSITNFIFKIIANNVFNVKNENLKSVDVNILRALKITKTHNNINNNNNNKPLKQSKYKNTDKYQHNLKFYFIKLIKYIQIYSGKISNLLYNFLYIKIIINICFSIINKKFNNILKKHSKFYIDKHKQLILSYIISAIILYKTKY